MDGLLAGISFGTVFQSFVLLYFIFLRREKTFSKPLNISKETADEDNRMNMNSSSSGDSSNNNSSSSSNRTVELTTKTRPRRMSDEEILYFDRELGVE